MVPDGLDRVQHEASMRAIEVERPKTLRRVGFHSNDGEADTVRQRGRRVLALPRVGDRGVATLRDVVSIDLGLTVPDRGVEDRTAVGQEGRLVVVAWSVRDVQLGRASCREGVELAV